MKLATTSDEMYALSRDENAKIIRSAEQWQAVLASPLNPIQKAPAEVQQRFTEKLKFGNGALGHAEYGELKNYLTYSEFEALWGVFGMSMKLFEAIRDTACVSNVCFVYPGQFCEPRFCQPH